MLCYKDCSWCISSEICGNQDCQLRLTEHHVQEARTLDIWFSFIDFRNDSSCPGFIDARDQTED